MKAYKFYNYPKKISEQTYMECYKLVLNYLIRHFPDCQIYRVGERSPKPGLSDLDFMVVGKQKINGDALYLRNFPGKPRNLNVLTHEPFGIDTETFKWLSRITSYDIERVYPESDIFGIEKNILPASKQYDFLVLTQYIVANYPMNFINMLNNKHIDVRRSISKLKKLLSIEECFCKAFGQSPNNAFINTVFRARLLGLLAHYKELGKEQMNAELLWLLKNSDEVIKELFSVYDKESKVQFNLNIGPGWLSFKNYQLQFSDQWQNTLYDGETYYLPENLSVINKIFNNIDSGFLANFRLGKTEADFYEASGLGSIINNYLQFCDRSNILNLILDYNFSVRGHRSAKFKVINLLGKIKQKFT